MKSLAKLVSLLWSSKSGLYAPAKIINARSNSGLMDSNLSRPLCKSLSFTTKSNESCASLGRCFHFFCQSFFYSPASRYSGLNSRTRQIKLITPLRESFSLSSELKPYAVSFVKTLLLKSRPSTIIRAIVTIYIYPIDRMLFSRSFAHIAQERFKATFPSVTNLNSTAPIVGILFVLRIITSALHVYPSKVLLRLSHAVRLVMRCMPSIVCLSGPFDIIRSEVFGVINSSKAMLGTWRHSNVIEKALKTVLPLRAHRYTASPMCLVNRVIRVTTPINNPSPAPIDFSARKPVGFSNLPFVIAATDHSFILYAIIIGVNINGR